MKLNPKITSQAKHYKMLPLSLTLTFGIIFFSCQNKENKESEVQNIAVTTDTSTTKLIAIDSTKLSTKKEDQISRDLPKVEQTELKQTTPILSEKIKNNKSNTSKIPTYASSKGEMVSQTNAEFPGGIEQFHNFFMKEYKKPEDVNYWKLNFTLAFAVEKNGSVSFVECSPAVEQPLEKEIIRVLNLCPKWQPGESNGKKVKMQYSVPILLK